MPRSGFLARGTLHNCNTAEAFHACDLGALSATVAAKVRAWPTSIHMDSCVTLPLSPTDPPLPSSSRWRVDLRRHPHRHGIDRPIASVAIRSGDVCRSQEIPFLLLVWVRSASVAGDWGRGCVFKNSRDDSRLLMIFSVILILQIGRAHV